MLFGFRASVWETLRVCECGAGHTDGRAGLFRGATLAVSDFAEYGVGVSQQIPAEQSVATVARQPDTTATGGATVECGECVFGRARAFTDFWEQPHWEIDSGRSPEPDEFFY